uniref:glucuronosyltransferase n=1 Tax=Meloidogyne enterolobii TaxID=390850 RepID=A0A6V7YC06_MELEN|nr:unnamed protein product [Meloidogyne enterolobii]
MKKYAQTKAFFCTMKSFIPSTTFVYAEFIKIHFANEHNLGRFKNFPSFNKIVNIGGIVVEEKKILLKEKIEPENNYPCEVLLAMGTVVPWYQENIPGIHEMLKIMAKQTHCHFTIRIHESLLPEYISENIHIVAQPRKVKQQELLARKNMKLFISHCGANSLLEEIL